MDSSETTGFQQAVLVEQRTPTQICPVEEQTSVFLAVGINILTCTEMTRIQFYVQTLLLLVSKRLILLKLEHDAVNLVMQAEDQVMMLNEAFLHLLDSMKPQSWGETVLSLHCW